MFLKSCLRNLCGTFWNLFHDQLGDKPKFVFSPDVIPCGWLGLKHQPTYLLKSSSVPLPRRPSKQIVYQQERVWKYAKELVPFGWLIFDIQRPVNRESSYQGEIQPIASHESLNHCSHYTSALVWRGFENNEVEWTLREKLKRQYSRMLDALQIGP